MKPPCHPRGDRAKALGAKALLGTNLAGAWGQVFVFPGGSGFFAPTHILWVLPLLLGTCRVHGGHPSCWGKQGGLSPVPLRWVEESPLCPLMALLLVFNII